MIRLSGQNVLSSICIAKLNITHGSYRPVIGGVKSPIPCRKGEVVCLEEEY